MSCYDNYYKRTVGDFFRDVRTDGLDATIEDRKAWGRMRMTPTDMSAVNAHTYTYLMHGNSALGNWTGLFRSGEQVRLRYINGSAMPYLGVRIAGLKLHMAYAEGHNLTPVTACEVRPK